MHRPPPLRRQCRTPPAPASVGVGHTRPAPYQRAVAQRKPRRPHHGAQRDALDGGQYIPREGGCVRFAHALAAHLRPFPLGSRRPVRRVALPLLPIGVRCVRWVAARRPPRIQRRRSRHAEDRHAFRALFGQALIAVPPVLHRQSHSAAATRGEERCFRLTRRAERWRGPELTPRPAALYTIRTARQPHRSAWPRAESRSCAVSGGTR